MNIDLNWQVLLSNTLRDLGLPQPKYKFNFDGKFYRVYCEIGTTIYKHTKGSSTCKEKATQLSAQFMCNKLDISDRTWFVFDHIRHSPNDNSEWLDLCNLCREKGYKNPVLCKNRINQYKIEIPEINFISSISSLGLCCLQGIQRINSLFESVEFFQETPYKPYKEEPKSPSSVHSPMDFTSQVTPSSPKQVRLDPIEEEPHTSFCSTYNYHDFAWRARGLKHQSRHPKKRYLESLGHNSQLKLD